MLRSRLLTTAAAIALGSLAQAETPFFVTTTADTGEGTLRAALAQAAQTGAASRVVILTQDDISVDTGLVYEGSDPLEIIGSGQTVRTAQDVTLLTASNGADLTIAGLNFAGPGGYSIEARADSDGIAGKGIFVDVRDDQTGTVSLMLSDVTVSGVANHGIHVSDCSLADACGGGATGDGEGSPASIRVHLVNVVVDDAGNGKFDADGVRVDERAEGGVQFFATGSTFTNVGADGVELDEGQAGDVVVTAINSDFVDNGGYCNPDLLAGFMPDVDEAEFEEGQQDEAGIPGPIMGSPDDGCFERAVDLYDDGSVEAYEFAIDVDDGFDIDESGDGSLYAVLIGGAITGNLDEGNDYDESGAGGIDLTVIGTRASGNADDGFKNSEEDGGDVVSTVVGATSTDNGGKGFVFEEEGDGDVRVDVTGTTTGNNDDSDDTGIEAVQEDDGTGSLSVTASDITDGIDVEGVDLSEM
ncbi:hypothetical protein JQU17_16855 [Ponticoccus sp. SC2-23]|uniref:hypothetical protein n=1 Tax=Alexandriicola marinus TaxID=2081710 RepID=UPI000FD8E072|nr:hypothetical protein [Alexandriicola marinus]MBM1222235.1 hypothetical protein [Ponticoccus sp. SC6-9]MBM1226922.1 hypothetical protein [Ponticoccus sp. SC6-15]MBM1231182.1 hypothetical protein [Ponticoccus sp. SC6-38]MBM1235566.1 hypothetical protein [Ponticoccus sp. SC6-45]MBM1240204.1 hypothetical protein [Ponticoccus sp. SC6-49]MBM1244558.1 hypothetical protein [Ponticoccus sp. SC2-64]MBM1249040.1 hypothetical protein [Ponticoccus sp. SC6-42]MBM1253859.1 hypothetical protein [Pontico